ncbi:MAG TPA: hypothetical protein VKV73_25690 [Chloroflexota bacterium]|nr:hypothetical protein [Chloroflexota bacterium]
MTSSELTLEVTALLASIDNLTEFYGVGLLTFGLVKGADWGLVFSLHRWSTRRGGGCAAAVRFALPA